jgi:hypothetical protein
MQITTKTKAALQWACSRNLPDGQCMDVWEMATGMVEISFQASTQAAVQALRVALTEPIRRGFFRRADGVGRVQWAKAYNEACQWWEYTATINGYAVKIYACKEAPAQCHPVTEMVEVEENVPVQFEKRTIQREVTRWVCPE